MTFLRYDFNEYGTKISVHRCDTCESEFTVCPAVKPNSKNWEYCLADTCESYDPARDADVLFMSDKEIKEEKPVVALSMLAARRKGVRRTDPK